MKPGVLGFCPMHLLVRRSRYSRRRRSRPAVPPRNALRTRSWQETLCLSFCPMLAWIMRCPCWATSMALLYSIGIVTAPRKHEPPCSGSPNSAAA
eukprot:8259738-Pyramimonas_sp.AAC.1